MKNPDAYFARAQGWAVDNQVTTARSRRVAWIIAGIAVAVALLEALALALLTPLKTVQPVTLLVDRQTGFVQALDPIAPRRLAADAALIQSFLAQYVTAREGFDRAIAATEHRKVALWSADRARSAYLSAMPATNPGSPFRLYPAGTVIAVTVKSVSRLSANTALVRFDTVRQDRSGRADLPQPWISVVRYRFVDAPMAMADRLVNPLGFQVWSYRRDAEAPAAAPPTAQPAVATLPSAAVATAPLTLVVRRPGRAPPVRLVDEGGGAAPIRQRREVPINQLPMGSPLMGVPQ